MSKARRLKKERASQVPKPVKVKTRAPLELLQEAIVTVGDAYGERPDCANAAALLKEAARHLGYELKERAVSMIIRDTSSGDIVVMGPRARVSLSSEAQEHLEARYAGDENNGHVILTCEDPKMLIDANLRQLGSHGIAAPSLAISIRSTEPESGEWEAEIGNLQLLYMLDEENRRLVGNFGALERSKAKDGKYLADMLKAGYTADDMRRLLTRLPD